MPASEGGRGPLTPPLMVPMKLPLAGVPVVPELVAVMETGEVLSLRRHQPVGSCAAMVAAASVPAVPVVADWNCARTSVGERARSKTVVSSRSPANQNWPAPSVEPEPMRRGNWELGV